MSGVLIPVVGPSGVGKDTLIDAARQTRPDIFFPRRVITRPVDAGGEVFDTAGVADFNRRVAAGGFAFHWGAHGLFYGIPSAIDAVLASGRHVLFNGSRSVLAAARQRYGRVQIVSVSAPDAVLAARLAARGREGADDIARRLARAGQNRPRGADVVDIDNGGALSDGIAAFLSALPASAQDAGQESECVDGA